MLKFSLESKNNKKVRTNYSIRHSMIFGVSKRETEIGYDYIDILVLYGEKTE